MIKLYKFWAGIVSFELPEKSTSNWPHRMSIDLCLPALEGRTGYAVRTAALPGLSRGLVLPKPQAQGPKVGESRRKQP